MKKEEPKEPAGEIEAPITINIGNLGNGSVIDKFDQELARCIANIYDLDTPAMAPRVITLKIKLRPSEDRVKIAVEVSGESSLASVRASDSQFYVAKDAEGNLHGIVMDPRQLNIFNSAQAERAAEADRVQDCNKVAPASAA